MQPTRLNYIATRLSTCPYAHVSTFPLQLQLATSFPLPFQRASMARCLYQLAGYLIREARKLKSREKL